MKVVLCGPPHSGKSCLREGLKQAIMPIHRAGKAPYPYVITACPDGEGSWYAETARRNPDLAKQLKAAYKAKFTLKFAQEKAMAVRNVCLPFTLIDVGGKIDSKNELIMSHATHAVILAGDMTEVPNWKKFCSQLNLQIIAVIYSDYYGTKDCLTSELPIIEGSIHYLERGEDVSKRPTVQALAHLLIKLSTIPFPR